MPQCPSAIRSTLSVMEKTAPPLLLIDVDGPLNPWRAKRIPAGYAVHHIDGFDVRLNPDHGPMLMRLATRFQLTWCTTWNELANSEIGPRIGLPSLPVLHVHRPARQLGVRPQLFWKLEQVLEAVGAHPFAWIDDEVSRRERAVLRGRQAHLRFVSPGVGLRQTDLDEVVAWAEGIASSAP